MEKIEKIHRGGIPKGSPRVKGSGRKKGTRNKVTVEVKELCARLLDDPAYLAALRLRLISGTAGRMEPVLWYYRYGKPKSELSITTDQEKGPAEFVISFGQPT